MPKAVTFRPHHVLCATGYEGKGYSGRFTANMTRIVTDTLRAPGGGATRMRFTFSTDDICAPCPKRIGALCLSQPKIDGLDARHAAALDLSEGLEISWDQAQARVVASVTPDDLDHLCKGCRWLEQGMCKAAVARLLERASGGDI